MEIRAREDGDGGGGGPLLVVTVSSCLCVALVRWHVPETVGFASGNALAGMGGAILDPVLSPRFGCWSPSMVP